jgi:hypothetical protein
VAVFPSSSVKIKYMYFWIVLVDNLLSREKMGFELTSIASKQFQTEARLVCEVSCLDSNSAHGEHVPQI